MDSWPFDLPKPIPACSHAGMRSPTMWALGTSGQQILSQHLFAVQPDVIEGMRMGREWVAKPELVVL